MSDPDSVKVMAAIDAMTPPFRALVHEFGAVIVSRMIGEGYANANELRDVLNTWRHRRQEELLKTDFFPRTRQ